MTYEDKTPEERVSHACGELQEGYVRQFSVYADGIVSLMERVAKIADRKASTFQYAIGGGMLVILLVWKLKPLGLPIADIQPVEFIVMALVSLILILTGTWVRIWQANIQRYVNKDIRELGARLLEKSHDATMSLLKTGATDKPGEDL